MTIARTLVAGLAATLAAVFVLSVGFAQTPASDDDILQRYELAVESLDAAVAALPDDAVEARSALDRAFSSLLTLSRGDTSALADSLDRVFERARTAIDNRSVTDLAVQAQVLIGGFQRLLFEAALVAAVEGDDALARERLLALAGDVGLGTARASQLEAETEPGPLRRIFEAGIAEQVAARLESLASDGAPSNRDDAYRRLARAYADFLLVQDSGRLDPQANERFVAAAQALVNEDDEGYLAALSGLTADLGELREAADSGAPPRDDAGSGVVADLGGDDAADDPASDATDPATEDEAATDEAAADEAAADDAASDEASEGGDAAATETTAEEGTDLEDVDLEGVDLATLREEIATEVRAEVEAEREAQAISDLAAELTALGVGAPLRDELAVDLHAAGVRSVASLEAELATLAASFQTQVLRGDVVAARTTLETLSSTYGSRSSALGGVDLAALTFRVAPDADARFRATLDRLATAPTLRSADASLLVAEVVTLSEGLRLGTAPALQEAMVTTSTWWSGWIRPVVMLVLALLALVPLRLVRLAFGGGNPNWSQVGFALFLLLLPIYVEGVIAAAALLADPLGMPGLAGWSVASIFASELTQFVWAAIMIVAVLVAISGFYGICVQFGVLGRRRNAPATSSRNTSSRTATKPSEDETLVDWDDEEF